MRDCKLLTLWSILLALPVAMPLAVAAQPKPMPSREDSQGQVMVIVTPLSLSKTADAWRFEVQLNTHVVPLTQDLTAVSVLSDGNNNDEKPLEWQGDPPGGHHRKGILVFKAIHPAPDSVTLKVRQVGSIPERRFSWQLESQ